MGMVHVFIESFPCIFVQHHGHKYTCGEKDGHPYLQNSYLRNHSTDWNILILFEMLYNLCNGIDNSCMLFEMAGFVVMTVFPNFLFAEARSYCLNILIG